MDMFGIRKRRAEKVERLAKAMRDTYRARKNYYMENIPYGGISDDVAVLMDAISLPVEEIRERRYNRDFDTLEEVAESVRRNGLCRKVLDHSDTITIDLIEMMSNELYRRNSIGGYMFGTEDMFFYRITDKDVLSVLGMLGFRRADIPVGKTE